jgi:hypothetical protein
MFSASSIRLCPTFPALALPATPKPVNSVVTAQGSGIDSVLFAWTSLGLRMVFAWASLGFAWFLPSLCYPSPTVPPAGGTPQSSTL